MASAMSENGAEQGAALGAEVDAGPATGRHASADGESGLAIEQR